MNTSAALTDIQATCDWMHTTKKTGGLGYSVAQVQKTRAYKAVMELGGTWPAVAPPPPPPPPQPVSGGVWAWDATTATVDKNSPAIIAAFVKSAGLPAYLNAGNAVVTGSPSDTAYTIQAPQGKFDTSVHIPAGTKAGCDDDGHLAVKNGTRWTDMYQARFANGVWSCGGGGSYDAGSYTEGQVNNSDAASMPIPQGLLTPEDCLPGAVPHPLVLSVSPACLGAATRYPGVGDTYPGSGLVGMGMWFRFPPGLTFDPTMDIASLVFCLFTQACGSFVRDGGSPVNICALDCVNRGGNAAAWGAVGVTLPSTVNGYPYAVQLSTRIPWGSLQALHPPSAA